MAEVHEQPAALLVPSVDQLARQLPHPRVKLKLRHVQIGFARLVTLCPPS